MTDQFLKEIRSAADLNAANLKLTGEQWGAIDPASILKLLDYADALKAANTAAADKLKAAKRCHPNGVDTLVGEALDILDGGSE